MKTLSLPSNRWKFVGPRLALSVVLLALFIAVVRIAWYPGLYWQLAGVSRQLLILAGVVLVIGVGLSTLVYRPGKRGMTIDLIVILVVEVAAVVYVGSLLYERRPLYLVFASDRLQIVEAERLVDRPFRFPELERTQLVGPRYVAARFPDDQAERAAVRWGIFFDGDSDIDVRPDHWYPYESAVPSVLAVAGSLAQFRNRGVQQQRAVDRWLGARGEDGGDYLVLPVTGKSRDATAVLDAQTGYPLTMLDVDPWE